MTWKEQLETQKLTAALTDLTTEQILEAESIITEIEAREIAAGIPKGQGYGQCLRDRMFWFTGAKKALVHAKRHCPEDEEIVRHRTEQLSQATRELVHSCGPDHARRIHDARGTQWQPKQTIA